MKKRLHIITNEQAFYLPYVLIIAVISLSLITSTIAVYKNESKITNTLIGQIEMETLIQMARENFMEDKLYNEEVSGHVNYTFPNGTVRIHYDLIAEEIVNVHFNVLTNDQFSIDIIHEIMIES